MKMLTAEIKRTLPKLYSQDGKGDNAIVHVKFFCPWSNWTWYVTEGEPDEEGSYVFFGLVEGHEVELGYFSLAELESVHGPGGLRIERDLYFKPQTIGEVRARLNR